jgi:hypothetical protein
LRDTGDVRQGFSRSQRNRRVAINAPAHCAALGIFVGAVGSWLARAGRLRRCAELVSGIALVVIGGYFAWLAYALTTS